MPESIAVLNTDLAPKRRPLFRSASGKEPLLGKSIFAKQLLLYVLIILLISGVISYFSFSTARQHLEGEIGKKLQYIARISARNTPFERLELIRTGDDQSRMVLRLKEKLGQIQEATGVENIIVFRPDMGSLLDLRPDVRIGSGYQLPHFTEGFTQQLEAGEAASTRGYRREGEAIFISAYAPVRDRDGRLFAIVGVDAGAGELEIIERMRNRLYWIAFAGIALACLLALFFARSISSPIRQMAHTAERLGRGDYAARARVAARDEVGILAESINRMAEQVRNRDAALKEMAASVAHEIRNPLNSIKLLVSLLDEELEDQQNDSQTATIETLHYEIGKLNRFIDDFLTYSRPVTLIDDRVSPASLVASVLDMAAAEGRERSVGIEAEVDAELPDLAVDRLRLEQTLLNLTLNAVQACEDGGRVVIRTQGDPSAGGISLVVEDTGKGIPGEDLTRIFEPFYTTKIDGTGLGLANARKIIEEHGGEIRVDNRPEGGARFTVRLPRARRLSEEGDP